eukprot:11391473-Heterocapsa_arctica.AAC.1
MARSERNTTEGQRTVDATFVNIIEYFLNSTQINELHKTNISRVKEGDTGMRMMSADVTEKARTQS